MDLVMNIPLTVKLALLGLAGVCLYYVYTLAALSSKRKALQQQKGAEPAVQFPQKDRPLGLDIFLQDLKNMKNRKRLQTFKERFDSIGVNTFEMNMLGRNMFWTTEPEILKMIMGTDMKNWSLGSRRISAFSRLLGAGIFTTDGAEWSHSRTMLRPNFAREQIADLDLFERHIQEMLKVIPRDGTMVDLGDLFALLTLDSSTEFLFGESTGVLVQGTTDTFGGAFNRAQLHCAIYARFGLAVKLLPWLLKKDQFKKDQAFIYELVDGYVHKGLKRRNELIAEKKSGAASQRRYTFIDELVVQTNDPIRIRSELLNILLAGRDTTAALLSNSWFELAKRPQCWQKLQEEVAALNGRKPTFEDMKEMRYLKAFFNESLRLYPVVPNNSREALHDTVLPVGGGPDGKSPLFVPKGQLVGWSLWTMHRRKDFYGEDADEFRPERWLDDPATGKKGLRVGWEYLPFNGGPRICLGQQFALAEASYTTIRLLQTFKDVKSMNNGPWTELLTLTATSLDGAKVVLTPR